MIKIQIFIIPYNDSKIAINFIIDNYSYLLHLIHSFTVHPLSNPLIHLNLILINNRHEISFHLYIVPFVFDIFDS